MEVLVRLGAGFDPGCVDHALADEAPAAVITINGRTLRVQRSHTGRAARAKTQSTKSPRPHK